MRHFKLNPADTTYRPLTLKSFEISTLKRFPYYQSNGRGWTLFYALCPMCNNPIQIFGLYFPVGNSLRPYAQHCRKPVKGFDYFNSDALAACPYIKKKKRN